MFSLSDLLSRSDYEAQRESHFHKQIEYLDACRRVTMGARGSIIFENRQTLWFRIHEWLRFTPQVDPQIIETELNWFNQLLPNASRLQAVFLDPSDSPPAIELRLASLRSEGKYLSRPNSTRFAHWIEFAICEEFRSLLTDFSWSLEVILNEDSKYEIPDSVRESLLLDLKARPESNHEKSLAIH